MKKVSKRPQLTRVCKPPFKEDNTYIYIHTYVQSLVKHARKTYHSITSSFPSSEAKSRTATVEVFSTNCRLNKMFAIFRPVINPGKKRNHRSAIFYLHSGQNLARCQNMPTVQVKSTIVSQHYRHISSKSKNGRRPKPSHNAVVAALLNLPCVLPA